jgi:chromosome partitioning protein
VKEHFRGVVFETVVPRNVRLSEAPSHGLPILQYDIRSKGAQAYMSLACEVLAKYPGRSPRPLQEVSP